MSQIRKNMLFEGTYVTPLCLGLLTMSPLQAGSSPDQFIPVLERAVERGINFFDTAELYGANHLVKEVLRLDKTAVINSKTYGESREKAKVAVGTLLEMCGRDYIDSWLLHDRRCDADIRGHMGALEYLLEAKEQGLIHAVGISTHSVEGVRAALKYPELEVIHPMLNFEGRGIKDGTLEEMEQMLCRAFDMGKGIYAMKCFGGGTLLNDRQRALDFILSRPYLKSVAIGMKTVAEVDYNCDVFFGQAGGEMPDIKTKTLNFAPWCVSCGRCVDFCPQHALSMSEGRVVVDHDKCILCGYCGTVCSKGAVRIF